MKRNTSKLLLAVVVCVALGLFILNPAFAVSDCNLVCEGSFVIDDIDTAADLEALSGCTSVTGDLSIIDSTLTSLEGLECLTHVGGNLDIWGNDSLTSFVGLERLKSVGEDLQIYYNYELCTSLAEALRDQLLDAGGIGGDIDIFDNKDC